MSSNLGRDCPKCNKRFASNSAMIVHMNKKLPCVKADHICELCNKIFATKQNLDKHMLRKTSCSEGKNKIIVRNFQEESVKSMMFKNIDILNIVEKVYQTGDYQINDFVYNDKQIKDIEIFKAFIKLIYKTDPSNKTIKMLAGKNDIYYHFDGKWIKSKSDNTLIKMVLDKIQYFIVENRFKFEHVLVELTDFLGENYNHLLNSEESLKTANSTINKNHFYINILKLELSSKIDIHQFNKIY